MTYLLFFKKIFSSLICGLRADGKAAQPGVEGDERSPGAEPVGLGAIPWSLKPFGHFHAKEGPKLRI